MLQSGMPISRTALAWAAFLPLFAACTGLASPYALPKLLALALAAAALSAAALRSDEPGPGKNAAKADILKPLGACLAVLALASVFSADQARSFLGEPSALGHGFLTLTLCAVIAALAQSSGPAFAARALTAGAAAGAALSAYAALQAAGLDPVLNAIGGYWYGRAGSLVGSPTGLGVCLAMLLPLQLRLALEGEEPLIRRAGWAAGALSVGGLLLTGSRGAWLAAAAGVCAYLYWTGRIRGPKASPAAIKISLAVLLAAGALAIAAGRFRPTGGSDRGRVEVWKSAWGVFAAHPLLGAGPDTFGLMLGRHKTDGFLRTYGENGGQEHAHNDLLEELAGSGLIGLAAYLWLLSAAWRRLREGLLDPERRADSAAAGAGLMAAFLFAKLNPIPLDGLALAALLLGLLDPRGKRPRELPAAALALSGVGALAAVWLLAADRRAYEGMKAQSEGRLEDAHAAYASAARLNPADARYGFWLTGLVRERARVEKDPARRLALGLEAVESARVAARWHPLDVRALHALGGSLAALALQGGPDGMAEAAEVLERGAQADRGYRPLLETRLTVATLRGDARAKTDSAALIARLDALRR